MLALDNSSSELTVVIPAYGECAQLPLLLRSLLAEAPSKLAEILVVDDGSLIPVEPSIQDILSSFPNARCVRKANGGGPSARNFGANQATGRRLLFLDQDLRLPPDYVGSLLGIFEEFRPAALSALYENRLQDTTTAFARWYAVRAQRWEKSGRIGREIADGVIEVHPVHLSSTNLLIERALYLECGGMPVYPRTGVEDQALGLLILRKGGRVLRTDRVKPQHVEERASLPGFCARQEEGAAATVRLVSSFPDVFGPLASTEQFRANGPLRLFREAPLVSVKKTAKAGVAWASPFLFRLVSWLEQTKLLARLLDELYTVMVAAHIQAGWREGLNIETRDGARRLRTSVRDRSHDSPSETT